jgi:hypothetical protein
VNTGIKHAEKKNVGLTDYCEHIFNFAFNFAEEREVKNEDPGKY